MNKKRKQRRGATTVELAFALPILLMFLFASYEFGRANMLLHAAESAAYEGARVGIIPGADKDKIEDAVAFVMNSVGASDFKVTVTPKDIKNDTEKVNVLVEVPLRKNTTITRFFVQDPVFFGECEMTRESL